MDAKTIKKRIRSHTKTAGDNGRCHICDTDKRIQNHHLLRVYDISQICVENHYYNIDKLYIPRASMCNEHHTKWHALAEETDVNITITADEIDKYIDLMNEIIIISDKIPEPLELAYIDLFTKLTDTIDKNIEINSCKSIQEEMDLKQCLDEVDYYDDI